MSKNNPAQEGATEVSAELAPAAFSPFSAQSKVKSREREAFSTFWIHGVSLSFACFMVFGKAFYQEDSWAPIMDGWVNRLVSLIQWAGWYGLFFWGIRWLFRRLDALLSGERAAKREVALPRWLQKPISGYLALLRRRPFLTVFCTLILANLPYMVFSYPAMFMGDGWSQFVQALGQKGLSNHHPVAHTLFLAFFLQIGEFLGDINLGMFFCSLTQTLFICGAIAYAVKALAEVKANRWLILGIILYYCIHPRVSAYFFLMTKDVIYSAFLLLFYVLLYKGLQAEHTLKGTEITLFLLSMAGMVLFRNDGKYVVILTLLAALLLKVRRKRALICLGVTLALVFTIEKAVFPLLHVEPGSIREMLSLPFQQTARYLKYAGGDVTAEEREVIGRVLDYDSLAEIYDPDLSDNVKATYHGTTADLPDYFRVWGKMFFRHPGIYLQATINNYYQYFYPGPRLFNNYAYSWSATVMEELNNGLGLELQHPPGLNKLRTAFEAFREKFFSLPFLSLLRMPAFYTWLALLAIAYCLRRKSRVGIVYCMPMAVQLLIFITGPTNGAYCRYEYPMILYLPVVIILGIALIAKEQIVKGK